MTATEFLNWIDFFVTKAVEKSEQKPCCAKGCHHCCDEVTYAEGREVDNIVAALTPEGRERVIVRLREWLEKAKPVLAWEAKNNGYIDGFDYRDLKITCPLLENGLCSVYERRPTGCRLFLATGNPDDCRMPMRRHQKFLDFNPAENHEFWNWLYQHWYSEPGDYVLDHLGVLLAERMLGEFHESTMRQEIEVK